MSSRRFLILLLASHACITGSAWAATKRFTTSAPSTAKKIEGHPGFPEGHSARADKKCERIHPVLLPAERNRAIVKASELVIVCPHDESELETGVVWTFVEHVRRTGTALVIIFPNGQVKWERIARS